MMTVLLGVYSVVRDVQCHNTLSATERAISSEDIYPVTTDLLA